MTTAPASSAELENTRKTGAKLQAVVLRQLARVTQERAAARMGVAGSTLSRFVSDGDLERSCQVLAVLGFRLAASGSVVVDPEEIRALKRMAVKYLEAELEDAVVPGGET